MMNKIKELVDQRASEPLIVNAAIDICESYQSKISDDRVCKLIVPEFKVLIYLYIYTVVYYCRMKFFICFIILRSHQMKYAVVFLVVVVEQHMILCIKIGVFLFLVTNLPSSLINLQQ